MLFQCLIPHKSHACDARIKLNPFENLDLCENWRSKESERLIEEKYDLPAERVDVVETWVFTCLFVITRQRLVVLKYLVTNRNLLGLIERSK